MSAPLPGAIEPGPDILRIEANLAGGPPQYLNRLAQDYGSVAISQCSMVAVRSNVHKTEHRFRETAAFKKGQILGLRIAEEVLPMDAAVAVDTFMYSRYLAPSAKAIEASAGIFRLGEIGYYSALEYHELLSEWSDMLYGQAQLPLYMKAGFGFIVASLEDVQAQQEIWDCLDSVHGGLADWDEAVHLELQPPNPPNY